jgi:hypothetical protein
MISSVRDMAKFIQMMNAQGIAGGIKVLRTETVEAMVSRQNGAVPLDFDFQIGFMWKLSDPDMAYAGRLCQHSGDRLTFQSYLEILTDHKLGVIVLANSMDGGNIHAGLAQQTLKLALEEKTGIKPPSRIGTDPVSSPVTSWSQARLNILAGVYITLDDASIAGTSPGRSYDRIEVIPDGLRWRRKVGSTSESLVHLVPRESGWFSAPTSQEYQYEFAQMNDRTIIIEHYLGLRHFLAERYLPVAVPAAWNARLGMYEIANLDPADWTRDFPANLRLISYTLLLQRENELLILQSIDGLYAGRLVIAPVSDTLGYMPGGGRNMAGAVRIITVDGQERLVILGLQYKKSG